MTKRVVSFWKFLVGGRGLSFRTGRYFTESMLVGAVTGIVVVAFRYMIDFGRRVLMDGIGGHSQLSRLADGASIGRLFSREALLDPHRWIMVVLPAAGGTASSEPLLPS